MMNNQPVEKSNLRSDGSLDVHHIWYTIQGEGPCAGTPAVFVRLAGCSLQCSFCDTDYTSKRSQLSPVELKCEVAAIRPSGLVVLTGGEPFRQNIFPVVDLLRQKHDVQVETNGTLFIPAPIWASPRVSIICSPKTPVINEKLAAVATAYKYVVDLGGIESDGLPSNTARPPQFWSGEIFVQPMDVGERKRNKANYDLATNVCMNHNYRLSLQMQKIVGVE